MRSRLAPVGRWLPYGALALVVALTLSTEWSPLRSRSVEGCLGGAQGSAGVMVDANGVLRTFYKPDPNGALLRQQMAAAKSVLDPKLAVRSPLRKVSLQRLERAVEAHMAQDRPPTDEMKYLAGLTRITHVFFYPDSGDIVVAGPAEPFMADLAGRVIGMNTGRSVVELQDLVVGLRAFAPGSNGVSHIGCSIDATKEGLERMNQFLARIGTAADPRNPAYTQSIVDGLKTSLGLQKVSILGISPNTHFAQVLVEADYRMKLIGIGLETTPVGISSYVDRADPSSVARNAMQRWWFVPHYNCVRVADNEVAMELVGGGVKLMGEDEAVLADGTRRQSAGPANLASQAFVANFTAKYEQLADKVPVYAQLRNLIDITVVAAFIHQQDFYGRAQWSMPFFGDEQKFRVETYQTPLEVETAATSRWKGNRLMTPVGGGVTIHPQRAIVADNLLADEKGRVRKLHSEVSVQGLKDSQWWWD